MLRKIRITSVSCDFESCKPDNDSAEFLLVFAVFFELERPGYNVSPWGGGNRIIFFVDIFVLSRVNQSFQRWRRRLYFT